MTALAWIAVFYFAVRVHTSGFGTYRHLLPIFAILNLTAQTIAIAGILIAILTGTNNIFSAPEYAFGADGKTWFHLGAHVVIGTTVGTSHPVAHRMSDHVYIHEAHQGWPHRRDSASVKETK